MANSKKAIKKLEKQKRIELIRSEQKRCQINREYRASVLESGRKSMQNDKETKEHTIVLEILVDAISACSTFINDRIFKLGIIDKETLDYANELQRVTGKRLSEQDNLLKDKSEDNITEFADRTDFIYDCLVILAKIPEEKRIIATSTLKTLLKK